ncbi:MAG: transglutaminaseTgpA domain-containing protein [Desulfonatronovibrio sp.]
MISSTVLSTQVSLRFLSPLLAVSAGSCVVFSLNTILAPWVILFWILSALLSFIAFYKGRSEVFSYNLRLIIVVLLVSLAVPAYWHQGWQYILAQALALMLGIKLMELRSQRDAFQFCGLGVLGLGVASLVRFDLGFGIMIFLFFFLGLVLILWQHVFDQTAKVSPARTPGWMFSVKLIVFAFILTVLTIILGLMLFFIFPRNINPMLNLGSGMEIYRTGFSAQMSPGSVSEIVVSRRIAFRAVIEGYVDPSSLYWRGAVLWETDGAEWQTGTPHDFQERPPEFVENEAELINQTITLNPGRTEYLFGLYFPGRVRDASSVYYNRDRSVKVDDIVETAIRYQVHSAEEDNIPLSPQEKSAGQAVPPGLDQQIVDLAQELGEQADDPGAVAREIMSYFDTRDFQYSLSSPAGFSQGQTLAEFLFETRTGYCELYAAAMTLLLRLNKIPSRIVVGYLGGEFNPVGGYWVVRDSMAHAWVEAWFEDRGWVLFDPTRVLEDNVSDETQEAESTQSTSRSTEIASPDQVMTPALRVVDWLRWQWTNAIIDFTLTRQISMWRSVRSGIQDTWSEISTPDVSIFREIEERGKIVLVFVILLLAAGIFIGYRFFVYNNVRGHPEDRFRRKAWKILARKTPGRYFLKNPGREKQVWEWWEKNHPDRVKELQEIYHAQRYGPRPDLKGHVRLKKILSGE